VGRRAVGLNTANLQGGSHASVKGQAAGLIHAVSYMRIPLVVLNCIIIFVKVLFG
jgi:hypothetical protein